MSPGWHHGKLAQPSGPRACGDGPRQPTAIRTRNAPPRGRGDAPPVLRSYSPLWRPRPPRAGIRPNGQLEALNEQAPPRRRGDTPSKGYLLRQNIAPAPQARGYIRVKGARRGPPTLRPARAGNEPSTAIWQRDDETSGRPKSGRGAAELVSWAESGRDDDRPRSRIHGPCVRLEGPGPPAGALRGRRAAVRAGTAGGVQRHAGASESRLVVLAQNRTGADGPEQPDRRQPAEPELLRLAEGPHRARVLPGGAGPGADPAPEHARVRLGARGRRHGSGAGLGGARLHLASTGARAAQGQVVSRICG